MTVPVRKRYEYIQTAPSPNVTRGPDPWFYQRQHGYAHYYEVESLVQMTPMDEADLFGAITGYRVHAEPSGHKAVAADFGIYGEYE